MRDIRFRVWHRRYEKFLFGDFNQIGDDDYDLETIFKADSGLASNKKLGEKYGFLYFYPSENIVIQQFTGLVDKNNKDIYEGDIITTHHYEDWNDDVGYDVVQKVKWCCIHIGWRGFTKEMLEKKYAGNGLPNPITIIGNIFENPNLLK